MTGAEQLVGEPEVCQASLEAASQISGPILSELSNHESILYIVSADRLAGLPVEDRLGIAALLHPDPAKSGVIVERWRLQEGRLPHDASDDGAPERMVALWAANVAAIPRLKVPEGAESEVMNLGDKLQMRGGGPVVFAREEINKMQRLPKTLVKIDGAANNAPFERIKSALAYAEIHGLEQPIVATVNPFRFLKDAEREKIASFAPEAKNELELFVDSGISNGFISSGHDRYGVRFLPDTTSYLEMQHQNGTRLVVLAPPQALREDGSKQTGVYNGYRSLMNNPQVLGEGFNLADSDVIQVTSSHYGTMAAMNNLMSVSDLDISLGSYRVIGDNQPTRTAQAHLIEIGLTTNALLEAMNNPRLATALLEHL
ncbi:MAG TPA: hypothetical protein VMR28_00500 [Candidatus Saccharimonadales bacterium]|nr:hypothetical protein [Candidatus Saccharimonadales bacterium]